MECLINGTVRVVGDVQNVIIEAGQEPNGGFEGQVHVGSVGGSLSLSGSTAADRGPPTAIVVDYDVDGTISVENALHRGLTVYGAVGQGASITLSVALFGPVWVGQGVHGTVTCGTVNEDGQLDIHGPADGTFHLAGVSGHVKFWNGMGGTLTATAVNADGEFVVAGSAQGQGLTGTATFTGNVNRGGLIDITGSAGLAGSVTTANMLGTIHVATDASGLLSIGTLGDPNDPNDPNAIVRIDGGLTSDGHVIVGTALRGRLEVRGDVHKTTVGPAIRVGADVTGQIRVYGSLYDDVNEAYEINVRGAMPFPGAIAIDWDGDQESDVWEPGAVIRIGATSYTGNTWQARVYEISSCRGDMQGDWAVGFPDINPFIMALNDVLYGTSNYAAAFPGLEGSMAFHGDADCSDVFDSADINPFVARVQTGDCDCGEARGNGEGADRMPPEELAALLAENVAPEQYDALLAVVAAAIDAAPDEEMAAYWQAVYAALTQ